MNNELGKSLPQKPKAPTTAGSAAWLVAALIMLVAIPLAAGAFAWAGITLGPEIGAVLMSLSTVVVALNAQLLRRVDLVLS